MRRPRLRDHSSFELKWLLRRYLLRWISPAAAVDFYAGRGRLLRRLAGRFPRVYGVEGEAAKAAALREEMEGESGVVVYAGDNREFVRRRLCGIRGLNYLDFDAYGDPWPLIREVFQRWRPEGAAVIAVTDGGRLYLCRGGRWWGEEAHFLSSHCRHSGGGKEGRRSSVRVHPAIIGRYELFVRSRWQELAERHHLALREFRAVWPPGRRVLYYGLCLEPD